MLKSLMLVVPVIGTWMISAQSLATGLGPRGGAVNAGGNIAGMTTDQSTVVSAGRGTFTEINNVTGSTGGLIGLGPRFHSNSCVSCHAQPAGGGSSPAAK